MSPASGLPALAIQKNHLGNLKKIPEVGFTAMRADFIPLEKAWVVGFPFWNSRDSAVLPSLNCVDPQSVTSIWKLVRNADSQAPPRTFRVRIYTGTR